jgi:uncharacterized protein (DUF2249 family)
MTNVITATLDVRQIPPPQRHSQIFNTFNALEPGQALQIVNDHDPRPLRYQFEERYFGGFAWTYVEQGPQLWRVEIGKLAAAKPKHGGDSCCGSCG